jgi:aminomethyltransferase
MSIYRRGGKEWDYAGYASSFLSSSLLRKPIALAKLPLDLCTAGSEVDLEVSVIRQPKNVLARVERMPFFNPSRKTALMSEGGV